MNRQGHANTKLFVGQEVEHTPAFGQKTLFVVGVQDKDLIEAAVKAHDCTHIYFGANQSFPNGRADSVDWTRWENMIFPFLAYGYWCTLDLDVSESAALTETGLVEHHKFIPMLSVKLPYLQQLGYNATIKIDDKDFAATNPGVWCHQLHQLLDRSRFTDWSQYTNDEIVR